jgi:hypothetical protein
MRTRAGLRRKPDRFSVARAAFVARTKALAQFAAYYLLEPVEVPVRLTRIPVTRRPEYVR